MLVFLRLFVLVLGLMAFLVSPGWSFETFSCTAGNFSDPINLNKGSDNGQCVKYVRYETGISYAGCNGNASTCYDDAISAGYAVGQTPRESAIIVFDADSSKSGLGVGHVGIVRSVDGKNVTIRDSNWVADYTVGEHTEDVSTFKIKGYIYCDGNAGDQTIEVTVPTQRNIGWTKGSGSSSSCWDGDKHFSFNSSGYGTLISKNDACTGMCQNPPTQSQVNNISNPTEKSFWSSLWSRLTNVAHELFGSDASAACESHYAYRTIRIASSGSSATLVSLTDADHKTSTPDSSSVAANNGNSGSLPNLKIDDFHIHDPSGNQLTESTSVIKIGQTYEIHVWPISKNYNCSNGIEAGKDTVETDTFYKISSDGSGDWKFLGRNYTRCENLTANNSHKETLHFTVPSSAGGKRVYFRSKVDSTGEVRETNEKDNWSDTEYYPVNNMNWLIPVLMDN